MDKEDTLSVYIPPTHIYTHTTEYYSATKKSEILSFAATWMQLDIIIQSEVIKKDKYHVISFRSGI